MSTRREATPASIPAIRRGNALDVGHLPTYGFGTRSLMWWGTAGMIAIEGTSFAFMIVIYFYLRTLAQTWPAAKAAPDLLWGTINLVLILLSAIPFIYSDRAAMNLDLRQVRIGMVVCSVFSLALCGVRWMEFTAFNVRWDESAYGSVLWMLMGLHTLTSSPMSATRSCSPRSCSRGRSRASTSSTSRRTPATGPSSC